MFKVPIIDVSVVDQNSGVIGMIIMPYCYEKKIALKIILIRYNSPKILT